MYAFSNTNERKEVRISKNQLQNATLALLNYFVVKKDLKKESFLPKLVHVCFCLPLCHLACLFWKGSRASYCWKVSSKFQTLGNVRPGGFGSETLGKWVHFKPGVIFTYEKQVNVGHSRTFDRFVYFYRRIRAQIHSRFGALGSEVGQRSGVI